MQISMLSILLVTLGQGLATKISRGRLPAPIFEELTTFDPPGIIIKWKPVPSDQGEVLGYKIRVWEAREIKIYRFKTVEGARVLVEEVTKPTLSDFKADDGKRYEYMVMGAQQSEFTLNHIKTNTPYTMKILAFGANGDGEPSSPFSVELQDKDNSTMSK